MIIFKILLIIIGSYLLGSVPFGLFIGKMRGIDVRKVGSCNIGATNVTRTVGPWYGKLCFFLDLLKGTIPVVIAKLLLKDEPMYLAIIPVVAGAMAIVGHMFSLFLKFTGGKGIATGGGIILGLAPITFGITFFSWAVIFLITRYVSVASIVAAILLVVYAIVIKLLGIEMISRIDIIFFALVAIVATYKHKENIKRLFNGTEAKFERKKSSKKENN